MRNGRHKSRRSDMGTTNLITTMQLIDSSSRHTFYGTHISEFKRDLTKLMIRSLTIKHVDNTMRNGRHKSRRLNIATTGIITTMQLIDSSSRHTFYGIHVSEFKRDLVKLMLRSLTIKHLDNTMRQTQVKKIGYSNYWPHYDNAIDRLLLSAHILWHPCQ